MHLATLERHIVSKALTIQNCHIESNDLAIGECQMASNQDDSCPCHLAMLVMSCSRHQAKGEGIHVKYNTPPTENLLKTKYTVITWHS
jgi:hypothetical protein